MKEKEIYFNVMKNYKRSCSNLVANISCYNWSDQFCREEIKSLYNKLINEFKGIDFTEFSIDELKELDFRMWDENIILMPVWALDCLVDGTLICSISGDYFEFDESKGLDKDERFGASAFGFNISQIRDHKLNSILDETI
jgi:hypothetical protein